MTELNDRPARRARPQNQAPAAEVQKRPSQGGSYVRQKDGTFERTEYTRQLDDPTHELNQAKATPPAAEPVKE